MFSQEFFIQRSFEVVWAVFRVAEHTTRPKIKQGLEDKATDYLLSKDVKSLNELEQIVQLAAQIKEINQVNAGVLLREVGNLRAAIMELMDSQKKYLELAKTPENAPQVEEVFSRPPMLVSDLIEALKTGFRVDKEGRYGKDGGDGGDRQKEDPARPLSTEVASNKSPASEQKSSATETENSAIIRQAQSESPARKTDRFEAVVGFKERNEAIMNILSKRNLCHIKDLTAALPNVSERTIRYDIQRLADKGIIERVGSGGPSSFFRLKKAEERA